jgi:Ca2+-binding RTX toxin-like protein
MIGRSTEVTTYRGHFQNHGSGILADYRTGPILERDAGGGLTQLRGGTPVSNAFDAIHAAGGYTQINHPMIFPSAIPTFSNFCRGCPWDYTDAETQYGKVDAIEVANGTPGLDLPPLDPGPNPFTLLALGFYDQAEARGNQIALLGGSDSHKAGELSEGIDAIIGAPVGVPATMVWADGLSESSVADAVKAGHTYVKLFGVDGPGVSLDASAPGRPYPAMVGDAIRGDAATFTARITGAGPSAPRLGPFVALVVKDGAPLLAQPVNGDDFTFQFPSFGPGRYRLQLLRLGGAGSIEALTSSILLSPDAADSPPPPSGPGNPGTGGRPDAIYNGSCAAFQRGTRKPDKLRGTPGGDLLSGLQGRDRIAGGPGVDCLYGGGGRDRLTGGPGTDFLAGGPANDRFNARDGEPDRIACGGGRLDLVIADRVDRVSGCELVRRK